MTSIKVKRRPRYFAKRVEAQITGSAPHIETSYTAIEGHYYLALDSATGRVHVLRCTGESIGERAAFQVEVGSMPLGPCKLVLLGDLGTEKP